MRTSCRVFLLKKRGTLVDHVLHVDPMTNETCGKFHELDKPGTCEWHRVRNVAALQADWKAWSEYEDKIGRTLSYGEWSAAVASGDAK